MSIVQRWGMQGFWRSMSFLSLFVPMVATGQGVTGNAAVPRAAQGAATAYAAVKRPSLPVRQRDGLVLAFPGSYPNRGVIVGRREFAGSGRWTVVDFDRGTIERLDTGMVGGPDGKARVTEGSEVGRPLSGGEVDRVLEEANRVWNPGPERADSAPVEVPTDRACDVVLFDGGDVLYGWGAACAEGTERLAELIGRIEAGLPPH